MTSKRSEFDVIIIGGGPAGLSALLWCAELGLSAILFEKKNEFGGQLLNTHNAIRNYLGFEAQTGQELRDIFLSQIERVNLDLLTGAKIVKADLTEKTVTLENGMVYSTKAIFIAAGVRRRKLMVPGEEEFRGCGILDSGIKGLDQVSGKTVVIVGGGDAALENAVILSNSASKVFIMHRRRQFTARREFIERARKSGKVEFLFDRQISAILGKDRVDSVEIVHLTSGKVSTMNADAVLIRVGVSPNTGLFKGQIALDDAGYVLIDSSCRTSLPGVFAGGDVANPVAPTISVAVGNGSAAVKAIFSELDL